MSTTTKINVTMCVEFDLDDADLSDLTDVFTRMQEAVEGEGRVTCFKVTTDDPLNVNFNFNI